MVDFTACKVCLNKPDSPDKNTVQPNVRHYPPGIIYATFHRNSEIPVMYDICKKKKQTKLSGKDQICLGKCLLLGYLSFEKSISPLRQMLVWGAAGPTGEQLAMWTIWRFSLSPPALFYLFKKSDQSQKKQVSELHSNHFS